MNTSFSGWLPCYVIGYYGDVIMFSVYGKINMMMMIPPRVELKLNWELQSKYTQNWKLIKDHFHTVL